MSMSSSSSSSSFADARVNMWRKAFSVQSSNALKGSDAKKFRFKLLELFPQLSQADVFAILPNKLPVFQDKCSNKTLIYWVEKNVPLFFDNSNGKGDIYPTLYAAFKLPHILPCVYTWHQVAKKLMDGADLMLPGVWVSKPCALLTAQLVQQQQQIQQLQQQQQQQQQVQSSQPAEEGPQDVVSAAEAAMHHQYGLSWMKAGRPVLVRALGNGAAIAVGDAGVDYSTIEQHGMTGRGVKVMHVYEDALWNHGDRQALNSGFKFKRIEMDPALEVMVKKLLAQGVLKGVEGDGGEEDKGEDDDGKKEDKDESKEKVAGEGVATATIASSGIEDPGQAGDSKAHVEQGSPAAGGEDPDEASVSAMPRGDEEDEKSGGGKEEERGERPAADARVITTEQMDKILLDSLLLALKIRLNDDMFPIADSTLYSNHMQVCNVSGIKMNIAQSSHKKLAKFLKSMSQAGVISLKIIRGTTSIVSVHRDHNMYTDFYVSKEAVRRTKKHQKELSNRHQSANNDEEEGKSVVGKKVTVVKVVLRYKPSQKLKILFEKVSEARAGVKSAGNGNGGWDSVSTDYVPLGASSLSSSSSSSSASVPEQEQDSDSSRVGEVDDEDGEDEGEDDDDEEARQGSAEKQFYTAKEAIQMLGDYISLFNLDQQAMVQMDDLLCEALLDGLFAPILSKAEAGKIFKSLLIPYHVVLSDAHVSLFQNKDGSAIADEDMDLSLVKLHAGLPKKVEVHYVTDHNKDVTLVFGLEAFGIDVMEWIVDARKKFASAVGTRDLPVSSKEKEGTKKYAVHIQGAQDVAGYLMQANGLPRGVIETIDKRSKKKK